MNFRWALDGRSMGTVDLDICVCGGECGVRASPKYAMLMQFSLSKSLIIAMIVIVQRTHACGCHGAFHGLDSVPEVLSHPGGNHVKCCDGRVAGPDFAVASPGRILPLGFREPLLESWEQGAGSCGSCSVQTSGLD